MKKILIFACVAAILLTLTACKGQASSSAVSGGESQLAASGVQGDAVTSGGDASNQSGVSSAAVSGAVAANTAPRIASAKALAGKNKGDYQVKTVEYNYSIDNIVYKATYFQLSGKIANLDKINETLKNTALQTINSLGTGKKSAKTTVKVNGDITYQGKNFISVGYNEYATTSPKMKSERVLRTVNIDLKTGTSVVASDLIVQNSALYKALEKAAKEQKDTGVASALTAKAIQSGLDSKIIYFTDYGIGLGVLTSGKHLSTITLTYQEVQPFMAKNQVWNNFI